jgi:hypothetical protein
MTRARAVLPCALALAAGVAAVTSMAAPAVTGAQACAAPEYRQFDFWLGDWDVFDRETQKQVARARVSSILGGCVLLEEYDDLENHGGRSFSIYDASRGLWHQSWVTDRGRLLIVEGHSHDGVMELTGSERPSAGAGERWVKGTWQRTSEGVREVAVRSIDGKKTWQPWFDLIFRPHAKRAIVHGPSKTADGADL